MTWDEFQDLRDREWLREFIAEARRILEAEQPEGVLIRDELEKWPEEEKHTEEA